jgi:hypothetical protein
VQEPSVYFIKGIKIQKIYDDGKVITKDIKTGDTGYYDQPEYKHPMQSKLSAKEF